MTVDELMKLLNKNGFVLAREFPQTIGGSWFEFKQTDD
jgi:predicted RNA binding protein YcfA (HicA-like mRNA interferase family)